MNNRIHLLDENTKNLIAAGEVIERPASVVKELVENALDAGAGRITIELEGAGNRLVRVIDDGIGMGRRDAELAFCRNATSKINSAEDLKNISTMGFRGEAIPSIAAVSRFELETCTREDPCGTLIVVEGGKTLEISDTSRAPGTTATVRNLFYNIPARRKFLKSDQTELRHIVRVVTSMAVSQIGTSFKLMHQGKELLSVAQVQSVAERLVEIFGPKRADQYIPVLYERGDHAVGGLIAAPDFVSASRAEQYMFINRRPFHSRAIVHAVRQGYQSTIPESAQPSFFLFLTLNPADVDVNVHPAKLEVRFRDEGLIYSLVHKAVQEGLRQQGAVARFGAGSGGKLVNLGPLSRAGKPSHLKGHLRDSAAVSARSEGGFQTSFLMPLKPGSRLKEPLKPTGESIFPAETKTAGLPVSGELDKGTGTQEATQPYFPFIWQLHGRYIFVETKEGCLIIDQHAAHERILYEKIMQGLKEGKINKQRLLFPVTLNLSPEEHLAAVEFKAILEQAGFEIEQFSGHTVVVRAVPALEDLGSVEEYFHELLRDLVKEDQGSTGTRHQTLARSLACRGAIKSGKKLSVREMNDLVDQLFATELPYADVHGRNTIVQLSLAEIDRRFGRS